MNIKNGILISFGSNVGNRSENIHNAIAKLSDYGVNFLKCSPLYETEPVGYENQNDFYNAVCQIESGYSPNSLLELIKRVESEMGRKESFRWGPREIDIDILIYNDIIFKSDTLSVPHKEIANRYFIVKMIEDISPEITVPGTDVPVSSLIKGFKSKTEMRIVEENILK